MWRFRPVVDANASDANEQAARFPSPDFSPVPAPPPPPVPPSALAPVYGPAPPPRGVRSGPEWRLFREMARPDVRSIVDRHVRNFLLLAWRRRDLMLEGRYHLEYVPAVSAPCAALSASPPLAAAPNEQSAPPSPLPDIDSGSESQANTGSARPSARAVRVRLRPLAPPTAPSSPWSPAVSSVAARLLRTLSVFDHAFPVWGASQFSPSSRRRRHFLCAGVVAVGTLAWCFEFSSGRRGGQPNAHCGGRVYALSNSRFTCANSIDYRSIRLFFLFARKSYLFIPAARFRPDQASVLAHDFFRGS